MSSQKLRLHKAVSQKIKMENLEYTQAEIQRNVGSFGVGLSSGIVSFNRLEWVGNYENLNIEHWPKREKGNLEGIKVLQEGKDFLLLFKPDNLVVSPGAGHNQDNLVYWLLQHYPEQQILQKQSPENSNAKISAGLVHRLDKHTKGLLLVAKNQQALDYFQGEFKQRKVVKKYLTVLQGKIDEKIKVSAFQTRHHKYPTRQKIFKTLQEAVNYDKKVKNNLSIFKPILYCLEKDQTLVEVEIKTGRMHQIRLQAEALGFPLLQEKVYNLEATELKKELEKVSTILVESEIWNKILQEIFGEDDNYLISNVLELEASDGKKLDFEYINLPKIIKKYGL